MGLYEGTLKRSILALKHGGKTRLARWMGELAFDRCLRSGDLPWPNALVPVPLHWRRRRQRGFNQAALIACGLGRRGGIPVESRLLIKHRHRPPQTGLSARARRRNAAGAYRARLPVRLRGARLLLVDDVLTTGATVDACARALLKGGAAEVNVVTAARVL